MRNREGIGYSPSQGRRQKQKFDEPVDYFMQYKDDAMTRIHIAAEVALSEDAGAGGVRSELLNRLKLAERTGQAGEAGELPDEISAPSEATAARSAQRATFMRRRATIQIRRDVRNKIAVDCP